MGEWLTVLEWATVRGRRRVRAERGWLSLSTRGEKGEEPLVVSRARGTIHAQLRANGRAFRALVDSGSELASNSA